jgi:hypothetical protein
VYDGAVIRRLFAVAAASVAAVVALAAAAPRPAAAQGDGRATIAFIPFQADKRLWLYGKPVAAEVTRALREAGLDVKLVNDGDPVPARARLVIDGRLVRSGAGVVIESRIRDPERGVDVARPSGSAAALDDIDRAAAAVAAELVVSIRAGLAAQDAQAARAAAALAPPAPPIAPGPTAPRHHDPRPLAVVVVSAPPIASADGAPVDVTALVAPAALELARRLGHRVAVESAVTGTPLDPVAVARRGARLVIGFDLLGFHAGSQRDIPVARARVRVSVYDASGRQIYRRVVRTDTLVGSRGDRVDTLIRFAAAQVTDVAAPRIRERFAATGAGGDAGAR